MFLSLPSICVIPLPKLIPLPLRPDLCAIPSGAPACRALALTLSVTSTMRPQIWTRIHGSTLQSILAASCKDCSCPALTLSSWNARYIKSFCSAAKAGQGVFLPPLGCFLSGGGLKDRPSASAFSAARAAGDRSSAISTPITVSTSMVGPSYACTSITEHLRATSHPWK